MSQNIKEWVQSIIISIIISQVILLIINPVIVKGTSMANTLHENQILLNCKINKYMNNFNYEDIVVVKVDDTLLVKRIIAMPGDTIEIKNNKVYINGKEKEEPYIKEEMITEGEIKCTLNSDEYFIMGDNRNNSSDSRFYGPFTIDNIVGKILFVG